MQKLLNLSCKMILTWIIAQTVTQILSSLILVALLMVSLVMDLTQLGES